LAFFFFFFFFSAVTFLSLAASFPYSKVSFPSLTWKRFPDALG
jgi:hypothetical protein